MSNFCAFCGKELPANIRQVRHRTQDDLRPICCNREHEIERRKRDGIFKMMSEAGKEARSAAVTTSNKVNPRRKKEKTMNNGLSGWSCIYCGQELSGPQEGQEHQERECRGSFSYEENRIMTRKDTTNKYKVSFEEEGAKSPTISQYTTKKAAEEDARILRKTEKNVKVEKIDRKG